MQLADLAAAVIGVAGGVQDRHLAALLSAVLAGWLRSRTPPAPTRPRRYRTVIAVDGKTLRGARLPEGRQVHLLSALDTSIVLAQVTVDTKSNESPCAEHAAMA